jgi:hypothetical protein
MSAPMTPAELRQLFRAHCDAHEAADCSNTGEAALRLRRGGPGSVGLFSRSGEPVVLLRLSQWPSFKLGCARVRVVMQIQRYGKL